MTLSTYAGNAVLNALFNNTALQIAAAYASLHSGDPGVTGADELASSNNYGTRPAIEFDAPTAGVTTNTNQEVTPTASGDWAAATYQGLWDAATAGNFLIGGELTASRTILSGEYGRWSIGDIDISITGAFGATTLENIINALFRNTSLAGVAYASLHSDDPGTTGANELSGNGYGTRPLVSFGVADAKSISNDAACETPQASGNWAAATYMGLWTAATEGTFIWGKQLTTPRTVLSGKKFIWAVGGIVVNIT